MNVEWLVSGLRVLGQSHPLPSWAGPPQGSPVLWLTLHLPWQVDEQIHACYAQTMSEWLGCEAIVRQRERESHAAALAKCSSGASLDSHLHQMMHRDSTISNEVMGASPQGVKWAVKAGSAPSGSHRSSEGWSFGTVSPLAFGWNMSLEPGRPDFELQHHHFPTLGPQASTFTTGTQFPCL